jgi:hypothetical protein
MDGKIWQCVHSQFSVKLGKSAVKTLKVLREALGEYSFRRRAFFVWHARLMAGRLLVEGDDDSWI